jgi:hypothetical protein
VEENIPGQIKDGRIIFLLDGKYYSETTKGKHRSKNTFF